MALKNEWPLKNETLNTQYWSFLVCRKENACCHQGIADVTWHINTKGHKAKQKALQSSCEIQQYSLPLPSAGAMTPQEMMLGSVQCCNVYVLEGWQMDTQAPFLDKGLSFSGFKIHHVNSNTSRRTRRALTGCDHGKPQYDAGCHIIWRHS